MCFALPAVAPCTLESVRCFWSAVRNTCEILENSQADLNQSSSKDISVPERVKHLFEKAYKDSTTKNTATDSGVKSKSVKYDLHDAKTPTREELTAKKPMHIVDVKKGIESASYADMKAAAKKIAEDQEWFDRPHHNEDTDSLIFITKDSFTHAFSNLKSSFGEDTIRSMAHILEIIKEAVLVDVSDPKDSRKMEKKVYIFFAAIDGVNGVEPVKLTIKEYAFSELKQVKQNIRSYFEKNGIMENYNTLYDAKALEVIGIESIKKNQMLQARSVDMIHGHEPHLILQSV